MILHTGNRTDIPAFYSEWFYNRIRDGYVLVRNPYNEKSVTRYRLLPEIVDLIVFCTKNPSPMLKDFDLLREFGQLWYVTITAYGKGIEPGVPDKNEVICAFKELSRRTGKDACVWRYDPVLVYEKYTVAQHIRSFEKICVELSGFTDTCVISFVELYEKVKANFPELRAVSIEEQKMLCASFSKIAMDYGMRVKLCGKSLLDDSQLLSYGIDASGCMTESVMEKALHSPINIPAHKPSRKECSCYLGFDIGAYNTCAHFCRYCYANSNREKVLFNMKAHDLLSPFLIGNKKADDEIHDAVQFSFKSGQMEMF